MTKKVFKRVISLVIALMMVLSGTQGFFAEALTTYTENDIVLSKTATPVGENTYDIQLSVKGKDIVTGKKVDVVLVIDNSNSMHDTKYGGKTLANITEEAANAFIDGVLTATNNSTGNVRVAVVQYGTYARAYQFAGSNWTNNWRSDLSVDGSIVYTTDNAKAKTAADKATTQFGNNGDGGTNTEGGFLMTTKVVSAKRSDAESIVVFMTDGMPTFRYDSDGDAARDGNFWINGGLYTSKNELNEAISAAQNLGSNSEIYTVALLSAFSKTSNEARLASNLLSKLPKTYVSDNDTRNIMPHVNKEARWKGDNSYAEKYYPIFSDDDASELMKEIYGTLAGTINALAHGDVMDVVPEDFVLTESKEDLESRGFEVTNNPDGTTTLIYRDVPASETVANLPKFSVMVKPGVYGTGYTNKEATYSFELYGTSETKFKDFPKPIVAINPTAANDDGYSVYQGDTLEVKIGNSILVNDETIKLEEGDYSVSNLSVEESYVTEITTEKGGKAVLNSDGTFVYTPPSNEFTGDDTFEYKNTTTVLGEGPLAKDYISNEATVTITVTPKDINIASYIIEHYVQNADFESYSLEETVKKYASMGEIVEGESINYKGYFYNPDIEGTVLSGEVVNDGSLTLKLFYDAKPFNVYYYPNGGQGEMEDSKNPYIYNEEVVVLGNEFIYEGYVFLGWGYEEQTLKPMSIGEEFEVIYSPDDTFDMPEANVILYALWEEQSEMIPYVVKYLEQESDKELSNIKEGFGKLGDVITENAIDIDGYTPVEPTEQELTLEVDGYNTITFWYVKDIVPEEPENAITIKHFTKTGNATEVLVKTETKPNPVTTGSALIHGADYKDNSIIGDGFAYQSSTPESILVYADATSQTAIESYLFELRYYKKGSSGGDPGGGDPGGPGGGGGGGTIIPDPEIPLAELEKIDHFAYTIGYPEGDIKPLNKITREEVAMIFYRLLTDESRDALLSDTNSFTDLETERWSNRAISTLFNADIISGYPDGTFKPANPITRAEFATIAAKFDELELGGISKFTDISGHWAEDYITSSELKGWINGYPDLTFRPEQDITRAEAMTLINNVLERKVPEENIHPDAMFWPDNPKEEWYYEAIMEATNSHDYVIEDDGDELWTGMKPNKVWP